MDLSLDQLIDLVNKEDLQSLRKVTEQSKNKDKENQHGRTTTRKTSDARCN